MNSQEPIDEKPQDPALQNLASVSPENQGGDNGGTGSHEASGGTPCPCGGKHDEKPPTEPSDKECWEMVRSAIEREDELIHQRLTRLLAGHAFLIVAFGAIQNGVLSNENNPLVELAIESSLFFVLFFAACISRAVAIGEYLANLHIRHLSTWWYERFKVMEIPSVDLNYRFEPTDKDPKKQEGFFTPYFRSFFSLPKQNLLDMPEKSLYEEFERKSSNKLPPIRGQFKNVPYKGFLSSIPLLFLALDIVLIIATLVVIGSCIPRALGFESNTLPSGIESSSQNTRFQLETAHTEHGLRTIVFDALTGKVSEALPTESVSAPPPLISHSPPAQTVVPTPPAPIPSYAKPSNPVLPPQAPEKGKP